MLGTGDGRKVYLQSSQLNLNVTTPFNLTDGQDNYILSRSGTNTVLTLKNASGATVAMHSFASNALPTCLIKLGSGGSEGGDTLTIDLSGGNPLAFTALTVLGTFGAGNVVSVLGSAGADTISTISNTLHIGDRSASCNNNITFHIDGAGGNDHLSSSEVLVPTSLIGGAVTTRSSCSRARAARPKRSTAAPASTPFSASLLRTRSTRQSSTSSRPTQATTRWCTVTAPATNSNSA
jgi:hypothetical protein